jgi:hypothetical protein|tara:strand:+ start:1018 stop:1209 length:192 start_codon:yes stop_codon:yes gene_type:complete
MKNQELIDRRFMQLEAKLKTMNLLLSRPGSTSKQFKDEIKDAEEVIMDLKAIIERDTTPLRNG